MSLLDQAVPPGAADGDQVAACLDRAVDHLLARQDLAGWWKGELRTNVTMDAEDLLLRHVLGISDAATTAAAARWIRSQQRDDGSWATFPGGPGDVSTSVEAYVGLRLAGDDPDTPAMRRAAAFVREAGGLEQARVFTHLWLALIGRWSWDDLPALPPELIWLPAWFPGNVYDWACWARQTLVPLTVVSALRPVRPVEFGLDELCSGRAAGPRAPIRSRAGILARLDRLLRRYHRRPAARLRRAAVQRAVAWIVRRQEADGSWGGIQPPWVYSILALHAAGYPVDHPVLRSALAGLASFTVHENGPDGPLRRLEPCQSPVWDTALAVIALREAGRGPDHPAVSAAVRWLLGEEIRTRGDWAVRRPQLPPGGWAFEFANDGYPDVDDTAVVVLALDGAQGAEPAVDRGIDWVLGMRSRDGGWAAFDADNTSPWCAALPFCDFGAVIDPPSADVTAHVVEMLAGAPADHDRGYALARGVAWLLAHQEEDGSWFGRWGANHVYGVGAAVPALIAAGLPPEHPSVRRAVDWTLAHQNPDGGWGEDLRSYRQADWRGRGTSTPSQTAWALLALLAAAGDHPAVDAGVRWLVRHQDGDGDWAEELFTGTGFPGDFYLGYELYRLVFPIWALARYQARRRSQER